MLPSNTKETDPFIFFTPSPFAPRPQTPSRKTPDTDTAAQRHFSTSCLFSELSSHTKPALLNPYDCLISSQGGYSPPFRKMTRKGGHGEAGGARRDSGGEKAHWKSSCERNVKVVATANFFFFFLLLPHFNILLWLVLNQWLWSVNNQPAGWPLRAWFIFYILVQRF